MKSLFYKFGAVWLLILLLVYGAFILKPITLGLFIAMVMYPMISYLEKYISSLSIRYFIILFTILILHLIVISIVGYQLMGLFDVLDGDDFTVENLSKSLKSFIVKLGFTYGQSNNMINSSIENTLSMITTSLPSIFSITSSLFVTFSLGIIFSYFFSIYYTGLKDAFLDLVDRNEREKYLRVCDKIPDVIRGYLSGMSVVMLILAAINTLIYLLIGLDYALAWGILSGLLAIIPYLGSAIALILPLSYSLITSDGITQPILIFFSFLIVQQLEGNILTPKIIGDRVNVNPLAAIIFMIISAQIWGIFGIFISIMVVGIVKLFFEEWKEYRTLATILSEAIDDN